METELRSNNHLAYPGHPLDLVPDVANAVAMARVRQQFPNLNAQGVTGDVIIGTTAISTGRTLYSSDSGLLSAVRSSGGVAIWVP